MLVNTRLDRKMSDSEIATFVFLDLETTGLIREGKPAPSVTELCMVAVQREDMLKTVYPRVLNNFVLCFNPGEAKLSTEAKQLTGKYYLQFLHSMVQAISN